SRSAVALAGYLAGLRLGATVVPLNPRHPEARNRAVCELSAVDIVLVDAGADPVQLAPLAALTLTDPEVVDAPDPGPAPAAEAGLDDVAYLLFTSGSTGRPKGVPIRHRNVSPYIAHNVARYAVAPGSRVSH